MSGRPRAVVVLTGSELVRGGKADANGPFLARELTAVGLEPERLLVVGDGEGTLEQALAEALAADLCVVSGGLGPTHDDRTIELLARVTRRPLAVDPDLEREIEAVARRIAERLGRPYTDFTPGIRKQASLPAGASSLGLAGTAPAVVLEHEHGVAVVLPGPPAELRRLWPAALTSQPVRRVLGRAPRREHRVLRFFGPSESAVARVLEEAGGEREGLDVTVCAAELEIQVDLFAAEGRRAEADALEATLRERFGEDVFASDGRPVAALVLDACRKRRWTLAAAESCTGGLVAARLTEIAGSSDVFVGSVVAYADAVKASELGVGEDVLACFGAVSEETAAAMAAGARAALGADVAVAVTGVAGPGGGTPAKPVGLVHVHAAAPGAELSRELRLPGGRGEVRGRATVAALHLTRRLLARSDTDLRDLPA